VDDSLVYDHEALAVGDSSVLFSFSFLDGFVGHVLFTLTFKILINKGLILYK